MNKELVLKYLGYRNQNIDNNLNTMIDLLIEEVKAISTIRYIHKMYKLKFLNNDEIILIKSNISLKGKRINDFLFGCEKAIVLATTLGINIDKKIKYYEKINLTKAVIFNSISSVYIDEICDNIELDIKNNYNNYIFTKRFSPGYGDLSLEIQKNIIEELQTYKYCGIYTDYYSNLIPIKSITAIIGMKEVKKNY